MADVGWLLYDAFVGEAGPVGFGWIVVEEDLIGTYANVVAQKPLWEVREHTIAEANENAITDNLH